ncbi:hypothetical protein DL96DRAFT_1739834 [Flagelloscypha sp. PMI_526]|nr:hypothetical protein DL96DRAFT_1739834 [Flagelloscypha sp. PMI_526]
MPPVDSRWTACSRMEVVRVLLRLPSLPMLRHPARAGCAGHLDLPRREDAWNRVSSDITMLNFLVQLDLAVDGSNMRPKRQLLVNQLKDSARDVSDDLVAVTCSNGISEYKKRLRVFQCLTAILQKVHCTTNALRRLSPVKDDLHEVEKLHQTVIFLLSCARPKTFLIIFHRSPNPNKLVLLPEVQRNLQNLSEHVGLLQRNARVRRVDAMGCPGGDPYEVGKTPVL